MISESEFDEQPLTAEIVPPGELQVLVKQSGLPEAKISVLLERFTSHFALAAEWAKKAKSIVVTNGDQVVTIKHARAGRLLLREKRLEIENIRKILKADALKEGQAIDRIANFLKDMIIPTEEHLDRQEHFVEYKKKAEDEASRIEIEKRIERERLDKERFEAEERKILQDENDRLRYEQEKIKKENETKIAEENKKRQIELELVRKSAEEGIAKERAEKEKAEAELRAKQQAEARAEADRIKEQERILKGDDAVKMLAFRIAVLTIQIPEVKSAENKRILEDAKSHLFLAVSKIKQQEEE